MIDGFRMNSSERFVRHCGVNSRGYLNIAVVSDGVFIFRCMCTEPSLFRYTLEFL